MTKIPAYLKKGDTIGITCPAGFMTLERIAVCVKTLEQWGYKVKVGSTLFSTSENYFSGSDAERLADFQRMLDDDNINAILCGRGGYGTGRIIEEIDFKKFRKKPKWIIGFSDITILHTHIFSNYNTATLHASMAAAFADAGVKSKAIQSLKAALTGKPAKYSISSSVYNKPGEASGTLIGGNLALLAHVVGSSSDVNTKNKILFIEDTGEYLYNIDRMLYQLKRSGKLKYLAGLVVGGFTDMKDTQRPFGKNIYDIVSEIIQEYNYPVCFDFPVSHDKENYALKTGVKWNLKISGKKTVLKEI
ncbi:LD-carboxypeptidase [Terrimonas sp.]|uniref:S66 peptidase family protein n=1 Tax=Terrimonas sp. TaxID=1914338 RepID=UPI000D5226E6|nr:LD-carboxypeptidase [Terrimonas sp.]PVD53236.1 LD-carboxypeptidase [Terrimonas sp.]